MSDLHHEELKTFRKKLGKRVVTVTCHRELETQARALLKTVAELGAKPMTIFFGGAPFRLVERDGSLEIRQPDYHADEPLQTWNANVSDSLLMLVLQTQLLASVGASPHEYRIDQTLIVLKEAVQHENIYMERKEPRGENDSGWILNSAEEASRGKNHPAADYAAVPLYALFQLRPAALRVLGLPIGYMAVFEGATLVGVANEQNEEVFSTED